MYDLSGPESKLQQDFAYWTGRPAFVFFFVKSITVNTIANTNNVYCIDTNTALKGVDGKISKEFIDTETGALTEKAYKTIADYVLCHTV